MKTWTIIASLTDLQAYELDGWSVRQLVNLGNPTELAFVAVLEREHGWTKAERRAEIGAAHINLKGSAE